MFQRIKRFFQPKDVVEKIINISSKSLLKKETVMVELSVFRSPDEIKKLINELAQKIGQPVRANPSGEYLMLCLDDDENMNENHLFVRKKR